MARISDLPATALTKLTDVRLDRAGPGFVLIGTDEKKDNVRFASLSETGQLGTEASATIPPRTLGPWFAATSKAAPGDQLLVVYGVASPANPGATELQILSLDAGGAGASAPRALQDPEGKDVVIAASATVQVAMGTATSGKAAMIAWGPGTQATGPDVLFLGARWRQPASGRLHRRGPGALGLPGHRPLARRLRPQPGGAPDGAGREADLVPSPSSRTTAASATPCRSNPPRPRWAAPPLPPAARATPSPGRTPTGPTSATSTSRARMVFVASDIVRGAVRFGGPDRQPRVACVAAMGKDFGITYDASTGPLVDRFSIFGNPRGSSLHLPSRGRPGAASAWPRLDATFLTYLDTAGRTPPQTSANSPPWIARPDL